jgi:N-methylhydantoinase B
VRRAGQDYGVALTEGADGRWTADLGGTQALRERLRTERLGGRAPAGPSAGPDPRSRPFSLAFRIDGEGAVSCAQCGEILAEDGRDGQQARDAREAREARDAYARLVVRDAPVSSVAPWSAAYPGSTRFVIRRLHCPACAAQVDVQVARPGDPVLRTAEPL